MGNPSQASEAVKTIRIGPDLRIAGAAAVFGLLRSAAEGAESGVTLDAGEVEKVDAAGLQALVAGHRALARAGKTVSWAGCSAQLRGAAGVLGLAEALELPR